MLSSGITSTLLVQILGAFRCGTGLLVIGVQNPIHSILLLIRVFFIGTLLLFTLQREYFAILFLIVYVGAIVVLFLFIIRRLEIKRVNVSRRFRDLFAYRHLIVGLVLIEVLLLISQDFFDLGAFFALDPALFNGGPNSRGATLTEGNFYLDWSKVLQRTDQLRALGGLLYTEYKISVLVASLLLFLARVGAIAITLPSTSLSSTLSANTDIPSTVAEGKGRAIKRQDANHQAIRHPSLVSSAFRG